MSDTETLVRQCLVGDPTGAASTFNELALARIAGVIDQRRDEVANAIFTPDTTPDAE